MYSGEKSFNEAIHSTTDIKKNVDYQEIDVTGWESNDIKLCTTQFRTTVLESKSDPENTVNSAVGTIKNKMCYMTTNSFKRVGKGIPSPLMMVMV